MARTYTDDQRTEAVALAVEIGLTRAAHDTGIPKGTIHGWMNEHDRAEAVRRAESKTVAATAAAKREMEAQRQRIRQKLLARAERMLDRLTEPEVDYRGQQAREVEFPEASPASAKALATTAAILIDKYRLELGEVTDRTEHRTVDTVTAEIERLTAELADDQAEVPA